MLAPQALSEPAATAEALIAASAGAKKPVIACWMGEEAVRGARRGPGGGRDPDFSTPERAVEAFDQLASYGRNQRLLRQVPEPLAPEAMPQLELARDLVRSALARGRESLTTAELRKLLGDGRRARPLHRAGRGCAGRSCASRSPATRSSAR